MRKLMRALTSVILAGAILTAPLLTMPIDAQSKAKTTDYSYGFSETDLEIKFTPDSGIYVENGKLSGETDKIAEIADIVGMNNVKASRPLFTGIDKKQAKFAEKALSTSGKKIPELDDYYFVRLKNKVDMTSVANQLTDLEYISEAYPVMLPVEAPVSPDMTPLQSYFAEDKLNTVFGHQVDGGRGENVTVYDVEYAWNHNHEDLTSIDASNYLANGSPSYVSTWEDHGTAVASIIVGDHNEYGVDGIAPEAEFKMVNSKTSNQGVQIGNAILTAAADGQPGDIILLEQQAYGPTPEQYDYVPVEITPSVYDAIVTATSMGMIVIEAAGNGSQNLDNTAYYGTSFPNNKPNSGAIIVGASNGCSSSTRDARASFSTYGSRVDVFADGGCVSAAGYGYYHDGGVNADYTHQFSGTSSASALMAGTVAQLSSVAEEQGTAFTAASALSAITSTGLVQNPVTTGNIGFKPKLRGAVFALAGDVNVTSCYKGGWFDEWFWLNVAKQRQSVTIQQAQKMGVNVFYNYVSSQTGTAPSTYSQTSTTNCATSTYTAAEFAKLEAVRDYYEMSNVADAQAFSGYVYGFLLVYLAG